MEFFMNFLESRIRHVGIYLGRRDRRMTEKFLDGADIGPVGKKGRRERVPERMDRNVFYDSGR